MLKYMALISLSLLLLVSYLPLLWALLQVGQRWRRGRAESASPLATAPTAPLACPACEAEGQRDDQGTTVPEPPPRIEQSRGRPRAVDTSSHFCPDKDCKYYGWVGLGNIRSNGHPNSGAWRQLACTVCGKTFMETTHTIFYAKKTPAETIWRALIALAEGVGLRKTARIFERDPNTIETWLRQAAQHMEVVSHYLIHELQLTQVQVDELWALVGQLDQAADEAPPASRKRWVWAGMDPVSKLLLACVVGDRSQACAQLLIHAIAGLLAPGCMPLFVSDQWAAYGQALLTHFGHWVEVPRRYARGRKPKPRWLPLPQLQYAQVVKERVKGRVVRVTHRVVYGTWEQVTALIQHSGVGQVINTAFIERLNLSIRQHVAALGRKVIAVAKSEAGLKDQLMLWRAYYNFCLPHAALRLRLPEPQPTKGSGSLKMWQPRTPAMAAGVTDHLWRMEEVLRWPVPPWRQPLPAVA